MPIHTSPLSRRQFLGRSAAALAGMTVIGNAWGAEAGADPNLFALFSDTHVPNAPDVEARGTNMTKNLRQVVGEVIAFKTKPAGVIINGDCAYLKGLPADYANLAQCVAPLAEAGLPLHVTMGNHDDRGPLFDALKAQKPEHPILDSKHVTVIESPHANWFLLDTLTQVNVVTGEVGAEQRAWLSKALTAHADKPALVMAHHTPQFEPPAEGKPWGGIQDTVEFMELLQSFSHVKAFIFGHSHDWVISKRGDLNLINLPPVAYVFGDGKPNGWVRAEVHENGLKLKLHTIDPAHKQNGETVDVTWG